MKSFGAALSDGQHEFFGHERTKVGRIVDGRRRNPETDVLSAIANWAKRHPGLIRLRRTHSGRSYRGFATLWHGPEGWPDFTGGTWFGTAVAVEGKREGGTPDDVQTETLATLREWGWIVIVAQSVTDLACEFAAECARRGHPIERA